MHWCVLEVLRGTRPGEADRPDDTLTLDLRDEMLRTLARRLPAAVLELVGGDPPLLLGGGRHCDLSCTVFRLDGTTSKINPPYRASRILPDLRAGMFEPGKGTWFSMRYVVDQSGEYHVSFDDDGEPEFDFTVANANSATATLAINERLASRRAAGLRTIPQGFGEAGLPVQRATLPRFVQDT